MSIFSGVLLVVIGAADIAWGLRMFALSRESARTGRSFREIAGAVPTVAVGVALNLVLVLLLAMS